MLILAQPLLRLKNQRTDVEETSIWHFRVDYSALAMWAVVITLFVGHVIKGCLVFLSEARAFIVGSAGRGMTRRGGGMYNRAMKFN